MRRVIRHAPWAAPLFAAALLALVSCRPAVGGAGPRSLRVFAPWSLEKRLRRIVEVFQETEATVPVRFTLATPGGLIKRIKAGERPDVYIAMGPAEIQVLRSLGLVLAGSPREILRQTLVLAVSAEAREKVRGLRDLARKDLSAVGVGRPTLTAGRFTRAALRKLGILDAVEPKAKTSPLRSLAIGAVQAAVIYEECCYEEDLFIGERVPRPGIAVAKPLPKELCEPFPVIAVALRTGRPHPAAGAFLRVLGGAEAQDILRRRGEWSCPICEMEP